MSLQILSDLTRKVDRFGERQPNMCFLTPPKTWSVVEKRIDIIYEDRIKRPIEKNSCFDIFRTINLITQEDYDIGPLVDQLNFSIDGCIEMYYGHFFKSKKGTSCFTHSSTGKDIFLNIKIDNFSGEPLDFLPAKVVKDAKFCRGIVDTSHGHIYLILPRNYSILSEEED